MDTETLVNGETPGIQILVSKYHSLVKGTRVLGAGIDLRSGVGKIQNEHGIFCDRKQGKLSKNIEIMVM